jgi:site-specific DNA-methyltransferase (adenine-specific)
MIILANKGRKTFNGARITDVWNFNRIAGKNQLHQNEKPIDLLSLAINKHSNENDVVLDTFAGSGSTGVACKQTNRKYILIEKEEKYCQVIDKRINFNL